MTICSEGDFHCYKIELLFASSLQIRPVCVCSFSFSCFCLFLYAGCQKKCTKSHNAGLTPPPPPLPLCPPLGTQPLAHIPPTLEQCRQVLHNSLVSHRYLWAMRTFLQVCFASLLNIFFCPCVVATICHACFHFFSKFVPRPLA